MVYPQCDDNVEYTEGLPCGPVRRILLEIGARLAAAGTLHAHGDVSFLQKDELAPALAGALSGESAAARVSRRRAESAWVLAHPGPLIYGPPPVPEPDLRGLPAAARRIMSAVLWAVSEELTPASAKRSEDGALLGIGVSAGSYTGPVRVIASCDSKFPAGALGPGSPEGAAKATVVIKKEFDGVSWHGEAPTTGAELIAARVCGLSR
ncbi:MAG: hypothetical protein ABI895_25615 [Deltaproteobacteria bacterium]